MLVHHGLINYPDTKTKCYIKKGLLQVFLFLRPPPLLGFFCEFTKLGRKSQHD
jgi:hypothetical protein